MNLSIVSRGFSVRSVELGLIQTGDRYGSYWGETGICAQDKVEIKHTGETQLRTGGNIGVYIFQTFG